MNKQTAVLFGCILLASCQSKKDFRPTNIALANECLKQSTCDIKILSGKSMLIKNDGNNTTYQLEDAPDKNVVVYKYAKIVKGGIQDSGYHEEIVFELDKNVPAANLLGNQLQNTKMLFGRFCYCKGQTGYYPVRQGKLSIDANYNGALNFTVSEVPQVIKQIRFSLK